MINKIGSEQRLNSAYLQNTENKSTQKNNLDSTNLNFGYSKGKKISLSEGGKLLLIGITKQTEEMVNSILQHPLKTATLIGGTALAMMAFPLIGIPSAVAGSAFACLFAGYAIAKSAGHALQFVKNNNAGNYNHARMNLLQLGEDSVDLALSVPFVPKSIKTLDKFAKYGKVQINKTLLADLKADKSIIEKWNTLKNTDKYMFKSLNYQSAVDKEITKLTHLTEPEKIAIKKELLDYNVQFKEISQVALKK